MKQRRIITTTIIFIFLASFGVTGCRGETAVSHNHPMASLEEMPKQVQASGWQIRESYQFAAANHEIADVVPCYCGCVGLGHTSLYECYVSSVDETGEIQFDNHAEYCTICNDITLDTMMMVDEGKNLSEIVEQIEADYVRFGPPTEKVELGD